jgi:hypothetical protein
MDIFYYWKNFEADRNAGRIGTIKSTAEKLKMFTDASPDGIWAFGSPKGRKHELQLLARLQCAVRQSTSGAIVYEPEHPASVAYDGSAEEHVQQITQWVSRHFPRMCLANFQGPSGQEALRGSALKELEAMAARMPRSAFRAPAVTPTEA